MTKRPDILCIGSVHWDLIGRAGQPLARGGDLPGRITRQPGGVALNIAMALGKFGLTPALLSAVGADAEGEDLVAHCAELGLVTRYIHRAEGFATDRYVAVEDTGGLIAAIVDTHTLEAAGDRILQALGDGRLGRPGAPYSGAVALDGNLAPDLMRAIAEDPLFADADLRIAPASPVKAERVAPFLAHPHATLYLNLQEARALLGTGSGDSMAAAEALVARGAARVLVTDGAAPATMASVSRRLSQTPPAVEPRRVTGAGDTFMAAHIAADLMGAAPDIALSAALAAAADFVSGEPQK